MSFQRYPKYKDSGVGWLGEVPEHWRVVPVRNVASVINGYPFDSSLFDGSEGYPLVRIRDLDSDDTEAKFKGNFIERAAITADDVLIGMDGDFNVGRWRGVGRALLNQRMCCIRGHTDALTRFLEHLLPIPLGAINEVTYSTTVKHLASSQIEKTFIALPPEERELDKVLSFLDRDTSKIDMLVAEQRRLIELLKEKRQAVISHAVTKGLNPNVPIEPSGIEWLGDVPAHWQTPTLKRLASPHEKTFTDGDWIETPYITEEGVRLIQTGNVGIGFYKEQGFRYVSEVTFKDLGCTEVRPRDVLICRLDGPVGRACLAPDLGVRMITSVDNAILKCADNVVPEFVVALFSSSYWISWIDALCRVGGGFRLRVSRNQLGELRVPLPPFEEQAAIAQYLAAETAKWDALEAESRRSIGLLQERRAALISAAVTGEIDVRNIAGPAPVAASDRA